MKIGELARATGVDVETIRYYERVKVLPAPKRLRNRYRDYGNSHLEQLAFIRHCRALDMPLADIRLLLGFIAQPAGDCSSVDRTVDAQLKRIGTRLKSLRALERQLSALRAQCRLPRGRRQCAILHELVAAAHAEGCVRQPTRRNPRTVVRRRRLKDFR